jgi:DnaJ-class molecular chaperone
MATTHGMDVAFDASQASATHINTTEDRAMDDYTHYDFLDLPPGASTARIEAAYQTIKQRLNGHSDEQMIRMIHEAYTVLSDTGQRQRYDAELQRVAAAADAELKNALDGQATRSARRVQDVPMTLLTAVSAWAA